MHIVVIHAPERCAPCRDMGDRIVKVIRRRPDLNSQTVEFWHADNDPDVAKQWGYTVIPTILLIDDNNNELYRSDGRCTEAMFETLLEAATSNSYNVKEFQDSAPSAPAVFYRTYSRRTENGQRETYRESINRVCNDIAELGKLNDKEKELVITQAVNQHALPSGRWMWVGGTDWIKNPANFSGAYNCTSTDVDDVDAFGLMMELAMMGSGTGAILESGMVEKLPPVATKLRIKKVIPVGTKPGDPDTKLLGLESSGLIKLIVGDSREGWVEAYQTLIDWAFDATLAAALKKNNKDALYITVDLSNVRPTGQKLKGFGGTANPVKLPDLFKRMAKTLNKALGRQLSPIECCLLIDEAAACIVAGNIRRSAGMRQFSFDDLEALEAKDNLYKQQSDGTWKVDTERENLRMANHTRCVHYKPHLAEVRASVVRQFYSGEGAIQYVPEAIARSNADLLSDPDDKATFLELYEEGHGRMFLCSVMDTEWPDMDKAEKEKELDHRMGRYGLNPCGEILGRNFHCNLAEVHLNTIDPKDLHAQELAFRSAALQVATLLHHKFVHERYQYSRSIDPIVGVSFTGLFDFFVMRFGEGWLQWMMLGRPDGTDYPEQEVGYLGLWRRIVRDEVTRYCTAHGLRVPNRTTTVQPAGTKSLLTGASSGWHPPKAQRFIRRITVGAYDPVALAAMDYGYSVIPAQSARDDDGNLLDDIYDPRSQEWLIEIPTEVPWANLAGCDEYDLSQLPVAAQFGLYMQVQNHYTEHNTSATIEFREHEIDELSKLIHDAMGNGYISAALLARFDANATFPRLPFEPISKQTYHDLMAEVLERRTDGDFHHALARHDSSDIELTSEAACTSAACIAQADKAESEGKR